MLRGMSMSSGYNAQFDLDDMSQGNSSVYFLDGSSSFQAKQAYQDASSSRYEQQGGVVVRMLSPFEVISSFLRDCSRELISDVISSLFCFICGVYLPKRVVLPLMGGMNRRQIPYQVTNAGDILLDLSLANDLVPKSDVTFPSSILHLVFVWLPLVAFFLIGAFFPLRSATVPNNSSSHNAAAGICIILMAVGMSEFITQIFKFYVGRLRPNFYAMCGFDKDTLECANGDEMEMEARLSFPSGHSSLSFCGMTTLVLFLLARVGLGRSLNSSTKAGKLKILQFMSFLPLLLSFWCATSRLVDNWHHPSDIIAGTIVGTVSACISYHLWFPQVTSIYSGIPLSVIRSRAIDDENKGGMSV